MFSRFSKQASKVGKKLNEELEKTSNHLGHAGWAIFAPRLVRQTEAASLIVQLTSHPCHGGDALC